MVCQKQARLSTIHEQLGYPIFHRLKLLPRALIISKELDNAYAPICPGCAYGKAHHKPTRSKGAKNKKQLRTATNPGQVVSVNQLVRPTPGLIPTNRWIPTKHRYIITTVFVGHLSDFTYIHLMEKIDGEPTVKKTYL